MQEEIKAAIQLLEDALAQAATDAAAAKETVSKAVAALDPIFTGDSPGPDPRDGTKPGGG